MGGALSSKRPSRVTEHDHAVLQLKCQRDQLHQYRQRIERNVDRETACARRLVSQGRRDRALLILRKKRFLESLVDKSLQQLDTLERLIHDVEFAQIQVNVVRTLDAGNRCLRTLNKAINLQDVERILDETKEAADYQQEISDILAGALEPDDELAAERELDELLAANPLPDLPSAVDAQVPVQPADRDKRLAAELAD